MMTFKSALALLVLSSALLAAQLPHGSPLLDRARSQVKLELPADAKIHFDSLSLTSPAPSTARVSVLSPHPPVGLVSFALEWEEGGTFHRSYASAPVSAEAKIAVAKSAIRIGEKLDDSNVSFVERPLQIYVGSGFFSHPEEVRRRQASGFLRAGDVLGLGNTRVPLAVQAGETLDLVALHGNLSITARVRALEAGDIGQWIRVENPSSKKQLQARVTAAGRAELH